MAGTAINTAQVNKKDIVLGQKMSFGAGEETSIQFDPRANQTIVSPGHISRIIAGDYKQYIGGVSNITAAGGTFAVPLVKDRFNTYKDFTKIMDKAKELEAKMKESQENIKKIKVEGISGANSVKVILDGEGNIKKNS